MASLHPWRATAPQGRQRFRDWLRRHAALLLQLLALALLALALAAPSIRLPAGGGELVVTVAQPGLDPAPLAAALAGMGDRPHSLVLAQPQPRLEVNGQDSDAVLAALAAVPDSHGGGDLAAALNLAAGLMAGQPRATGLILASGAAALPDDRRWTVLPAAPDRFRLGPLVPAAGVDSTRLLYHLQGPPDSEFELLLETSDWATAPAPAGSPGADARLVRAGRLPADGQLRGHLAGLPANAQLRLWLGRAGGDEYATAAVGPPNPARGRVYVAANDPGPYRQAALAAGHAVADGPDEDFDIAIYVGQLPEELPAAAVILIDPPHGPGLLQRDEPSFDLALADRGDSLLADIPTAALASGEVRALQAPPTARSHANSGSGSWLWQDRLGGREIAVLAFDPASGLSGQAAFPLLVRDLLALVDPQRPLPGENNPSAGAAVALRPHPRARSLTITDPTGAIVLESAIGPVESVRPDAPDPPQSGEGIYWRPRQVGLHWIEQQIDTTTLFRTPVWVQAAGPGEAPGAWAIPLGDDAVTRMLRLWPLLAGLGVVALLAEWTWFSRRRGAF